MAPRTLAFLLAASSLLGSACIGPTGRPPEPPNSARVQEELGERDVIQAGQAYAQQNSLVLSQPGEAVQIRPNYWRVRFGLPEKGSGKVLELEFDSLARHVTRVQEIDVVSGEAIPVNPSSAAGGPTTQPPP
ncbi:hypothetical protein JGU66_04220 [Myxococcaceae bacterium JPH2]|nr:hypothetical protein [Myxococcaceae bacterium JPH2]